MTKSLTAARANAYQLLLKTYEILYRVERQLSDDEARLLRKLLKYLMKS